MVETFLSVKKEECDHSHILNTHMNTSEMFSKKQIGYFTKFLKNTKNNIIEIFQMLRQNLCACKVAYLGEFGEE